ncbi:adenine phosphoribosyltransferase [Cellulophaga sp. Hel_I_12]|uniref:adenine phosphoribosyltransferase n=1 Tax=Cellulophaga sp. Hel_I_12 TaxID=1249972 RepID=UPI000646C134|nr:adenine phosphoribosyltransferase [Cellulophaga sp. Hel_I_12]
MDFKKYIRDVNDFPNQGVVFKDITPLLLDAEAFQKAAHALYDLLKDKKIAKVVGLESRGFFFAPLLAAKLNAGFVPIRKQGKLPYQVERVSYALEYGSDTLEIHKDSIHPGDKVLVHDDVLATGGTAAAACELITRLGGEIVQCNFLIELDFLNGRNKLKGHNIASLVHY